MKTRIRTVSVAMAVVFIGLSGATAGCGKYSFNNLKAMKAFKEANDHYRSQRWREAIERYEAVIAAQPNFETQPDFLAAYFFLGNSYDNLFKPARKGEAENDGYMTKAIENYTVAAERAKDPLIKRRSLEYLVAAYASDKLNDPAQAEPVVQQDDRTGPERADRVFPAVQDLRGCRPVRRRRGGPVEGPRGPARPTRPFSTPSPGITTARVNSTRRWRPSRRPPSSSRTTRRATT